MRSLKELVRSLLSLISRSVTIEVYVRPKGYRCAPVNMRCNLFVYSTPQICLSFEIILASASPDADTSRIMRFKKDVV